MGLVIEHGWWAVGAAVLLLAAVGLWVLQRQRSGRWRAACVGFPASAAVLIALAMARPGLLWSPPAKRVVMLLDLSGSTRESPWRDPAWVKGLAQRRLGEGMQLTVVGFGGLRGPRALLENASLGAAAEGRWPTRWDEAGESEAGSDITAALRWRSDAEARGEMPLAPRWVITDGLVRGLEAVESSGLEVAWTAIPPHDADVGVVEIGVRATADSAGVEVWARISASAKATAVVRITRDGGPLGQQQLSFSQAGTRWVSVHDAETPAGSATAHRYEVAVERLPRADPWPENDRGSMIWSPQAGMGRVLVIGSVQGVEPLGTFQRRIVRADQFPRDMAEVLAEGWQVIVLNDLPLALGEGEAAPEGEGALLPAWSIAALDRFVRETGGGLVILGRRHAFGPGHYLEGGSGPETLEGLSPVFSEQHDRPPARVVFVLDASGSMNESAGAHLPDQKFRVAARGVEQAMSLLLDEDQVTVVTFNDRARKIAQGTRAELMKETADSSVLRARLDEVRPTGNTVPDAALEDIAQGLGKPLPADKSPRMVVLLTDGEIPQMDQARWKRTLEQSGAALTVVAPPPADAEHSALQKLARDAGATWLATDDAGQWATLLKRAVARQVSGAAVAGPIPWRASGTTRDPLRGVAPEYIEVWKKPESRENVTGEKDGRAWTLGAAAQRGLGKVAALAMGEDDDAYAQLLQQMVRDVMPPPGDRRFTLGAQRDGDSWLVTADGADGQKFLDGERLKLRAFHAADSGQAARAFPMPQTGPGRYQCRVENSDGLVALVVREGKDGEEMVGRIDAAHVAMNEWPASFEGSPVMAPRGATVLSADADGSDHWRPRLREWRMGLERWLWTLGALSALAALWLRRGPTGGRIRVWRR